LKIKRIHRSRSREKEDWWWEDQGEYSNLAESGGSS